MLVLGIDSGENGALAFVNENGKLLNCYDMPFIKDFPIKHVNVFMLFELISKTKPDYIYLEEVAGIRGKSTMQTVFVQGGHYHPIGCAVCEYLVSQRMNADRFHLVKPQQWKKALGVIGGDEKNKKSKTIELIKKVYPDQQSMYTGVRGGIKDGRTDAIAIALYGLKDLKRKGLVKA